MTFSPAPPFFSSVLAAAARCAADTGLWTSVVLAQWADETAYGTSQAWVYGNNPAGISPDGVIASYPSQAAGFAAWVETMTNGYYAAVIAAKADGAIAQAYALGASPWAAGHYTTEGGTPGQSLVDIINDNDLTEYDGLEPTLNPPTNPPLEVPTMPVSAAIEWNGAAHVFQVSKGALWHKTWANPPVNESVLASAGVSPQLPDQVPGVSVIGNVLVVTVEDSSTDQTAWLFALEPAAGSKWAPLEFP